MEDTGCAGANEKAARVGDGRSVRGAAPEGDGGTARPGVRERRGAASAASYFVGVQIPVLSGFLLRGCPDSRPGVRGHGRRAGMVLVPPFQNARVVQALTFRLTVSCAAFGPKIGSRWRRKEIVGVQIPSRFPPGRSIGRARIALSNFVAQRRVADMRKGQLRSAYAAFRADSTASGSRSTAFRSARAGPCGLR